MDSLPELFILEIYPVVTQFPKPGIQKQVYFTFLFQSYFHMKKKSASSINIITVHIKYPSSSSNIALMWISLIFIFLSNYNCHVSGSLYPSHSISINVPVTITKTFRGMNSHAIHLLQILQPFPFSLVKNLLILTLVDVLSYKYLVSNLGNGNQSGNFTKTVCSSVVLVWEVTCD